MTTQTHNIDVPPSRSLIAAVVLIVSLGVLALVARVNPPAGWAQLPPAGGSTEVIAEFGD